MAIYDIFEIEKKPAEIRPPEPVPEKAKDHFFSALLTRFFFLLLLLADLIWAVYATLFFAFVGLLALLTLCKAPVLTTFSARRWLALKRSLICAVALGMTLFSPSFGIMIACTYFLMYDKSGIEEVVPASLQEQFKEFFKAP